MVGMFVLWLKHRWRQVGAAAIALLAVGLVLLLVLGGPGMGFNFLGNAGAPRPAAASGPSGVVLPRSGDPKGSGSSAPAVAPHTSLLDQTLPMSVGPQTVADAQSAWSADEIRRHEDEVLAAVNCARRQQGQGALTLNPALSQVAGDAWLKLVHDHSWSLMQLPGRYTARSVMSLDFGTHNPAAQAGTQQQLAGDGACAVGGSDVATLPASSSATSIGIAVFPPQASWDSASAVVLIQ